MALPLNSEIDSMFMLNFDLSVLRKILKQTFFSCLVSVMLYKHLIGSYNISDSVNHQWWSVWMYEITCAISVLVNVWLQSVLSTDQNSLRKILISCLPMHCGSRIKTSSERNDVMQNLTFPFKCVVYWCWRPAFWYYQP